jgi:hypothetical protein
MQGRENKRTGSQSHELLLLLAIKDLKDTILLNQDGQTALLEKLVGFEIPAYDYLALTYVTVGNGIGEIETVTYKTGGVSGTTVAVLTLAYDVNNNLVSVTKS